jgi:hypothetical protein
VCHVDGIGRFQIDGYATDTYSQHPVTMGGSLPVPSKRIAPFVLSYGIKKDLASIWFQMNSSSVSMFKTNGNAVDTSVGWYGTAIYLGYVVVDGLSDGTKLMTITVTGGTEDSICELYYSGGTISVRKTQ